MSIFDDDILEQDNVMSLFQKNELFAKELLQNSDVNCIVAEEKEDILAKKLSQTWKTSTNNKKTFAQQIFEIINRFLNLGEQGKHKSRDIYSIDCRTLHKGDAYGWLSKLAEIVKTNANPIIIIENVTQIPDASPVHDAPTYVANLLLRSWKNEQIYAGDIHIDRRNVTVILTCPPQDADILGRECGLCSYNWIGDFETYLK